MNIVLKFLIVYSFLAIVWVWLTESILQWSDVTFFATSIPLFGTLGFFYEKILGYLDEVSYKFISLFKR